MAGNKSAECIKRLRQRVLAEVSRLAFKGTLREEIDLLPDKLLSQAEGKISSCCEYKEKAIYKERIKLALGLSEKEEYKNKRLSELIDLAFEYPDDYEHQINVMEVACAGCPIDKFFITNACQNCFAHACQSACHKGAISIIKNQAYIDKNICIECGACRRVCPYGAIVEIHRPCEASCAVGAIKAGSNRKSHIDEEKCVECGSCVVSCPFGAIFYRSQVLKVVQFLKNEKVCAIIAPAYAGQFGQKENSGVALKALELLGFTEVYETALGADIVTLAEKEEFNEKVPNEERFMTTSCCPSFVGLIKKHFPKLKNNISTTPSPMVALATYLRKKHPDHKVVFLGPCIAKKTEAWKSGVVDAVLTFEELNALFMAKGINVPELDYGTPIDERISSSGKLFAKSGGVTESILNLVEAMEEDIDIRPIKAQGLEDCAINLKGLLNGKIEANFLEGMGCEGGCIGGPGNLIGENIGKVYLNKSISSLPRKVASEDSLALEIIKEKNS